MRPASAVSRSALVLASAALGALAAPSLAEDITVNTFGDAPDLDPNDGVCDADPAPGLQCTLRAAIMHANTTVGADTITLPAGKFKLTIRGSGEDAGATGDLDVGSGSEITIEGAGVGLTVIDGKKAKDRVLDVLPGGTLSIRDLTIQKGQAPEDETGGGGVRSEGTTLIERCVLTKCKSKDDAGALDVQGGSTTVIDSLFSKNKSDDDGGAIDVDGGSLLVRSSTFVKNKSKDEGGAIENSGQSVSIESSTFSANAAKDDGGAIVNEDGGEMTIAGCTFVKNKARFGSGLSTEDNGDDTEISNSIFDNKKKDNFFGDFTSLGGNLDSGSTGNLGAGELSNTKPKLGPLQDNGGPTPTHSPTPGSPVVGAGNDSECTSVDQRGVARTLPCDIGAVEAVPQPR